jgi:hypothetical protein
VWPAIELVDATSIWLCAFVQDGARIVDKALKEFDRMMLVLKQEKKGKRLFCSAGKLSCHLFCHFCHILPFLYGAEHSCNLNGTIFAHSFMFEWGKFDAIH